MKAFHFNILCAVVLGLIGCKSETSGNVSSTRDSDPNDPNASPEESIVAVATASQSSEPFVPPPFDAKRVYLSFDQFHRESGVPSANTHDDSTQIALLDVEASNTTRVSLTLDLEFAVESHGIALNAGHKQTTIFEGVVGYTLSHPESQIYDPVDRSITAATTVTCKVGVSANKTQTFVSGLTVFGAGQSQSVEQILEHVISEETSDTVANLVSSGKITLQGGDRVRAFVVAEYCERFAKEPATVAKLANNATGHFASLNLAWGVKGKHWISHLESKNIYVNWNNGRSRRLFLISVEHKGRTTDIFFRFRVAQLTADVSTWSHFTCTGVSTELFVPFIDVLYSTEFNSSASQHIATHDPARLVAMLNQTMVSSCGTASSKEKWHYNGFANR